MLISDGDILLKEVPTFETRSKIVELLGVEEKVLHELTSSQDVTLELIGEEELPDQREIQDEP